MKKIWLPIIICYCVGMAAIPINAQDSYRLTGNADPVGSILFQEFENGDFWIMEALSTGEPITDNNLLRITIFDACGISQSFGLTYPGGYGIINFHNSFIDGDTLRMAMRYYAKAADHGHAEIGFLSIHTQNLGHRYNYLRAENTLSVMGFFPTQGNKFFVQAFLSYIDRPVQYGSFLLDKHFRVEQYYENFGNYSVSGNATEIPGGYFVTTPNQIYKLDYQLNPVWMKKLPDPVYTRQIYPVADGVVCRLIVRKYEPMLRNEYGVIKIDFNGNIVWVSENFNFDEQRNARINLIQKKEGDFEFVVSKQSNRYSNFNKDMVIFTIDAQTGSTLKKENSFESELVDSFRLRSLNALKSGGRLLLIEDQDEQIVLWNLSEETQCNLLEGGATQPLAPIFFEDSPLVSTITDIFYTGGYQWEMVPTETTAEKICYTVEIFEDLLPEEQHICTETGWSVDLSSIIYPIIWENGSRDKNRTFLQAGTYEYQVDSCDIEFKENIIITAETCECQFYIPNIFSPDNNGVNDQFEVFNKCPALTHFELRIFSRWGGLMYYSDDQYGFWDGKYDGKDLNVGVFVYVLEYQSSFQDQVTQLTGTVALVRE